MLLSYFHLSHFIHTFAPLSHYPTFAFYTCSLLRFRTFAFYNFPSVQMNLTVQVAISRRLPTQPVVVMNCQSQLPVYLCTWWFELETINKRSQAWPKLNVWQKNCNWVLLAGDLYLTVQLPYFTLINEWSLLMHSTLALFMLLRNNLNAHTKLQSIDWLIE